MSRRVVAAARRPRIGTRTLIGVAALLLAIVAIAGPAVAAPVPVGTTTPSDSSAADARATDVASVARALETDPLYASTAPGTPSVNAGDVRGAVPRDVYIAVLPAAAAAQTGGESAALPGAILGELQRPGTVLVLVGRDLVGSSRSQSFDRLQQVLTDARNRLSNGGSPTSALVLAARGLTGSGQLSDPPSAARAGSPSGGGFLWVVLALAAAAVLAVPVLLRRARQPRAVPPPQPLRDRVEIDAYGRVVRRVRASDRGDEQEAPGRDGSNRP
jgi:hypothetical protein